MELLPNEIIFTIAKDYLSLHLSLLNVLNFLQISTKIRNNLSYNNEYNIWRYLIIRDLYPEKSFIFYNQYSEFKTRIF